MYLRWLVVSRVQKVVRASQLSKSELERMMVTEETELARLGTQMGEKGFHVGSKALIFIYITEFEIHVRHSSKGVRLPDTRNRYSI